MLNVVTLIGRTTGDAELRYTPNNKATASVSIAVDRDFKDKDGEKATDFFRLTFWGKSAENFANWIKKGRLVSIQGRLENNSYEKDGQRVTYTNVIVTAWNALDKDPNYQGGQNTGNAGAAQSTPNFARENNSPFRSMGNPMDIADDDLPF